jgi:hypothetical protein
VVEVADKHDFSYFPLLACAAPLALVFHVLIDAARRQACVFWVRGGLVDMSNLGSWNEQAGNDPNFLERNGQFSVQTFFGEHSNDHYTAQIA